MSDPDTIATYETVAEEYCERHGDRENTVGTGSDEPSLADAREDVAEIVEAFLLALDREGANETGGGGSPSRVLDVGCGPGWESATFEEAGYEVLGLDLTTAFLDAATETAPGADFARMDMRQLGLAADVADGLWACASFIHVPREETPATLEGFARVLNDGGALALSVKRGEGTRAGDAYEGDDREFVLYEPAELCSMVEAAGFAVEDLRTMNEWIFLLARA